LLRHDLDLNQEPRPIRKRPAGKALPAQQALWSVRS